MEFQFTTRTGYESNYSWLRETYAFSWDSFGQTALARTTQTALDSFQDRDTEFTGWRNAERFIHWKSLMLKRYPRIPMPF